MRKRRFFNVHRKKRNLVLGIFVAFLFCIGVGYSSLFTNLNIFGTLNVNKPDVDSEEVSYDNTDTGIDCTDVQCVIDYLNHKMG